MSTDSSVANSRLVHRCKSRFYSITSSADALHQITQCAKLAHVLLNRQCGLVGKLGCNLRLQLENP